MCIYICVYIYIYIYIYIYTLVFKSVANFICIKFIDLFLNFWTGVYICVCVYIYTYTYIHIYIYIYIYTHTYIYTYTCIYIHIHIHLCIYLHILTFPTREIQWYSAYSFLTRVSKKASQGQRQLSSLGTLLVLISSDFICNLSLNKRQHRPLGPVSLEGGRERTLGTRFKKSKVEWNLFVLKWSSWTERDLMRTKPFDLESNAFAIRLSRLSQNNYINMLINFPMNS